MFYNALSYLCNENSTTVTAVLKELGYSTSKGTALKSGSIPNGEILAKIADYFNVSTDYLLGRETPPQTDAPKPPILEKYNKLNHAGKRKAEEYISDLAGNSKYTEEYAEEISCGKKRNNVIDIMPYLIHKK